MWTPAHTLEESAIETWYAKIFKTAQMLPYPAVQSRTPVNESFTASILLFIFFQNRFSFDLITYGGPLP
jgi:hypothetical protein